MRAPVVTSVNPSTVNSTVKTLFEDKFAPKESILGAIPGPTENERLLIVLLNRQGKGPDSPDVELRHQSWGDGIGWFTQNTVPLAASQVETLRATLGAWGPQIEQGSRKRNKAGVAFFPRLCTADSA